MGETQKAQEGAQEVQEKAASAGGGAGVAGDHAGCAREEAGIAGWSGDAGKQDVPEIQGGLEIQEEMVRRYRMFRET